MFNGMVIYKWFELRNHSIFSTVESCLFVFLSTVSQIHTWWPESIKTVITFAKTFLVWHLEHSGLRSKVSNISNGTLLIAKLAQDEEKIRRMNISQFCGPTHTFPAPSLPRLINSHMNSSLKLIAYKGVVTSCFEALKLFFKQKLLKIDDKNSNWWANMIWSIHALLLISPIYNSNFYKCFWKCFNTSRKYLTPSSPSLAHIITKPDSSNKSPSESGWFTAKCNSIPLLLPAHYHMSPTNTIYMYTNTIYMYTWSTKWEKMVSIVVWSNYYCQESILFYCLHTCCKTFAMIFSLFTAIIRKN